MSSIANKDPMPSVQTIKLTTILGLGGLVVSLDALYETVWVIVSMLLLGLSSSRRQTSQ